MGTATYHVVDFGSSLLDELPGLVDDLPVEGQDGQNDLTGRRPRVVAV